MTLAQQHQIITNQLISVDFVLFSQWILVAHQHFKGFSIQRQRDDIGFGEWQSHDGSIDLAGTQCNPQICSKAFFQDQRHVGRCFEHRGD